MQKNTTEALSTYIVLYRKLRGYHWNVKGQQFFVLHEELNEMYEELMEMIDEFAEKMQYLGFFAESSLKQIIKHSLINDFEFNEDYEVMMKEILGDYKTLIGKLSDVIEIAQREKMIGMEDLAAGQVSKLEKRVWMVRSYLNLKD